LPWVFDWGALQTIDAEASGRLSELFRSWIPQDLDMRWLSGDRLFVVIQDAAPTGVRDADPAFWQLRLDALRMTNRPDQFDEAAIDYCVTYEVSPPSWEAAKCIVRISGSNQSTTVPPLTLVSDVSTSFQESQLTDDPAMVEVATVELSGQLVGDIATTLKKLDAELGKATIVNVSCARLIRVDFIAAGDLLNWVLARRAENRSVSFIEAHRMVALFFGAMGINEHATVKVRTI
jgi:ABC-type transporter Mla MlaB component